MGRVALVLRGGVSRISGRLLNPEDVSNSNSRYVNFRACAKSIQKNIIEANPDFQFDVFIQSWNPDLQTELSKIYLPKGASFENNDEYAPLLHKLTLESLKNQPKTLKEIIRGQIRSSSVDYKKTFAGISQALAIKKGVELINEYGNSTDYDHIILFRPDVVLLRAMKLAEYLENFVYVNNYADLMGDFHWVFHPQKIKLFSNLVESIDKGNYHQQHYWIRDYFRRHCDDGYVQDKILAGKDEEVMRQVKYSKIPFEVLKSFGVSDDEYHEYNVIS
jgi:hypothetical protein